MEGALDPMVEEKIAPNRPRVPDARMESYEFKTALLIVNKLSWIERGVVIGDIVRIRGVIKEIAWQFAASKSILIANVILSSAEILVATGFQPKLAVVTTLTGSNHQPSPDTVITSALGTY